MLKIIFMGTPDFAAVALQALLDGSDQVVAVVTQPDRPKGRGKRAVAPPVKMLAEQAGIPVLQPLRIKTTEFCDQLAGYEADIMVVAAYGRILPPALLELTPYGAINVHGSLLPAHRGAAPIQRAIMSGDKETGITIMQMDEGLDTGDILLKNAIPIDPDDTTGSLFEKLAKLGSTTLCEALELLRQGKLSAQKQDAALASTAPMLKKEDGLIDWTKNAAELHCLIRGLDPWPSAYCFLNKKRVRLFQPEIWNQESPASPGTIVSADRRGLIVATGEDCLLIKEIQPEGKKRMPVEAFLCGAKIAPGTQFNNGE